MGGYLKNLIFACGKRAFKLCLCRFFQQIKQCLDKNYYIKGKKHFDNFYGFLFINIVKDQAKLTFMIFICQQVQSLSEIIRKMGNKCCSPELDAYQIKLEQKIQIVQQKSQRRKGLPSEKIAIRVTDINKIFKTEKQLQAINQMIFIVSEDERKKFRQPMRINKQPIPANRLKQPYYIKSLGVFYVGQWIFNQSLNENIPGGIGRLYEDGTISEGLFKTFLKDADEDVQNQYNNPAQAIEKILKADRQKLVNFFHFDVKLDGQGRICSTAEQGKSQITLQGQFSEGILHGKGSLKMITNQQQKQVNQFSKKGNRRKKQQQKPLSLNSKSNSSNFRSIGKIQENSQQNSEQLENKNQKIERKTEYFYTGLWKFGNKHGKGVEKVQYFYKEKTNQIEPDLQNGLKISRKTISSQSFRYQGSFHENTKHGKGSITFLGTNKHQHQVQRDIERMQKQKISEGEQNIKAQALKKVFLLQQQQQLIQQKLDSLPEPIKQKLKKSHLKLSKQQRLLLFDSNFTIQRKYRTTFNQNYTGDFKEGKMQGTGTYTWPNGKIYRGKWQQDKMNGKGQFYWPDGTYYVGNYVDDQRYGEGIMVWNVWKRYRGDWAFGMRHGYGEAIQIVHSDGGDRDQQRKDKLVIKGYIWDRDKVKKVLFEQVIEIPSSEIYVLERKADQRYEEQMLVKDTKKNKQITKLQTFKETAEYKFHKLSSQVSKFMGKQ